MPQHSGDPGLWLIASPLSLFISMTNTKNLQFEVFKASIKDLPSNRYL